MGWLIKTVWMLCCWLPDSILLKNIWDCQTRLNMNAWSKSAFAATAVPLGVQEGKIAKWRFFQRHHPIYCIIITTTYSPTRQPALQTKAQFLPKQPFQCLLREDGHRHNAEWKMGQRDPLSKFYFTVLAHVLAKIFPSSEGFHLIQPQLPK